MEIKKFNLLFFSTLCLLHAFATATDVHYCDKKADYDVEVKGVEISPDPVARGQPATFSIAAATSQALSGGKLVIDLSYFGWHVYSETHDLCGETPCPVSAGNFVIAHSQVLPGFTPPGSYALTMKMYDGNKHELTCVKFGFDIGFGSSVADI
uniref:MD-2-related lipid-recognition domain-containing protein n=1 Tax=Lotus japonicus TaxID=34305 RepID=I3T0S6_LOTJA|nr:unknown [Lotus japonicus]